MEKYYFGNTFDLAVPDWCKVIKRRKQSLPQISKSGAENHLQCAHLFLPVCCNSDNGILWSYFESEQAGNKGYALRTRRLETVSPVLVKPYFQTFWTIKPTVAGLDWDGYVQVSVSEQYCIPPSRDPAKVRTLYTQAQRVHIKPEIATQNPNPSQLDYAVTSFHF